MDHLVIDTTPKGSAILAYGTSRGPRRPVRVLAIIAGLLLLGTFLALWLYTLLASILLPANTIFLTAMKPKTIQSKMPAALLEDLPFAWRTALQRGGSVPVVLGYASRENGGPLYYAVMPGRIFAADAPGIFSRRETIFTILADTNEYANESFRVRSLFELMFRLRDHDASWQLRADILSDLSLGIQTERMTIIGTWDGIHGEVNLPPDGIQIAPVFHDALVVTLASDRREADPAIDALLSQGIDLRGITTPPSMIAIDASSSPLVRWYGQLGTEDDLLALGAFGKTTTTETILPDGTIAYTLRPVLPKATHTSDETFSRNRERMPVFNGESPEGCPGTIRLRLADEPLKNLLISWGFSENWQKFLRAFEIRESEKVCARIETKDLQK